MDRRAFLTRAALGGATIVGASALGALDGDAAFARPRSTLDPAIAEPVFAEGRIGSIQGSMLHVAGSWGETHHVQLTNATSVWKLKPTSPDRIEIGDGMYGRGVLMPDGTIAADAIWVNIVNLECTLQGIGRDKVELAHDRRKVVGNLVGGVSVAAYGAGAPTADLSRLRIGAPVRVLGAWRPDDDSVDVARLTQAG